MSKTDDPLKRLFKSFPKVFAEWLIEEAVQSIEETNIELPVSAIRSDQVFYSSPNLFLNRVPKVSI